MKVSFFSMALCFGMLLILATNAEARTPQEGARLTGSGSHNNYGFTVDFSAQNWASLRWSDGYPGFTASYNPNPSPAPRCPCHVYEYEVWEGDDMVRRRIEAEFNGEPRETYTQIHYSKTIMQPNIAGACVCYAGNAIDGYLKKFDCAERAYEDECNHENRANLFDRPSRAMNQKFLHFPGKTCNDRSIQGSVSP